ncbi:unnamed protein product, partial [marine sediment metagenome]
MIKLRLTVTTTCHYLTLVIARYLAFDGQLARTDIVTFFIRHIKPFHHIARKVESAWSHAGPPRSMQVIIPAKCP